MTHHSYDRRNELFTTLPDFWGMYYNSTPTCERTRALLRGSMEITRMENGGALPPEPSTDGERAHASLCADEYRKLLVLDPHSPLTADSKVFLHNFCYPAGIDGTGRSLHFLAECHSREGNVWYIPTERGWVRYEHGPAVTHVRCEPHDTREFTSAPLLSVSAFYEDIARIDEFGARLALGKGPTSYLFNRAMHALSRNLAPRRLEPCDIGQVAVERGEPTSTLLRVSTTSLGRFNVRLEMCDETWRIVARAERV